jgi:predicted chitinase
MLDRLGLTGYFPQLNTQLMASPTPGFGYVIAPQDTLTALLASAYGGQGSQFANPFMAFNGHLSSGHFQNLGLAQGQLLYFPMLAQLQAAQASALGADPFVAMNALFAQSGLQAGLAQRFFAPQAAMPQANPQLAEMLRASMATGNFGSPQLSSDYAKMMVEIALAGGQISRSEANQINQYYQRMLGRDRARIGGAPGSNPGAALDPDTARALRALEARSANYSGAGLSSAQLKEIVPRLNRESPERVEQLTRSLNSAMAEAGIKTPKQQAAFVAQLAHESGGFKHMEELASGAAYEGRRDLGNTQPGDGQRFKGRGPIQLTGRANYRAAGEALGLPLEQNPEMVANPEVGMRVAAWYWKSRNLNSLAEAGDFAGVTRRINGGYNGWDDRMRYYGRALTSLA